MDSSIDSRGRWALLIAVDRYPNLGERWQLDGCVNDLQIMRDALIRRFGFQADRIQALVNEQATRSGILAAMEELVCRVETDDIVVVHYSGHGSQQVDGPEEDEPDGMDETIVPHDSGRTPKKSQDITDDEIHAWLERLTTRTPYVTLIFDCCHSGTITRGKTRSIPPDGPGWLAQSFGSRVIARGGGRREDRSGWAPFSDKYVLFAACASEETAAEIVVGEPVKVAHGALTYYLVRALMATDLQKLTCHDVFERFAPQLAADCREQHPQLEGARHREIFGCTTIRPMSHVPVLSRSGDRVILRAGDVCGMTAGSRWIVYHQGTKSVSDDTQRLGTVEILAVGVTTSEGRILDEVRGGSVSVGSWAIEEFRALKGASLDVEIVAPPGNPSAAVLSRRIAQSKLVRQVAAGESAGARVHLLSPGSAVHKRPPGLQELTEETWAALDQNDDHLLLPPFPRVHPQAIEAMAENLERIARLRGVLSLQRPESSLAGLIDFDLYRLAGAEIAGPLLEKGLTVFQDGDGLVLEIHNRSAQHVYVYVLDIGLTGRVGQVYPDPGSCELLLAKRSIRAGAPPSPALRLFIPEDFPLLQRARGHTEIEGMETLKLFASTSPADFGLLDQPGYRFRTGGVAKSLNEFLTATLGGGGYGTFRSAGEDWTTVQKPFLLRARPTAKAVA